MLIKIDLLSIEALDKMHVCLDLLCDQGYIERQATLKETYEKSMLKLKTLFERLGKEKTNQLLEILGDISRIYKEDKEGELLCLD